MRPGMFVGKKASPEEKLTYETLWDRYPAEKIAAAQDQLVVDFFNSVEKGESPSLSVLVIAKLIDKSDRDEPALKEWLKKYGITQELMKGWKELSDFADHIIKQAKILYPDNVIQFNTAANKVAEWNFEDALIEKVTSANPPMQAGK